MEAQQENARFHSHLVVINLYELTQSFVTCEVTQGWQAVTALTFCLAKMLRLLNSSSVRAVLPKTLAFLPK